MQQVVGLVEQPVECLHDAIGCSTGWTAGCIMYTNIQLVVQPWLCNRQPSRTTGCMV